MADSIREQIFKKVEANLRDIVGIGEVHRGKLGILSLVRTPAVLIVPGDDDVTEEVNTLVTRDLNISLLLWEATESNPHEIIEAFIPKIQVAMTADHTLGGLAIDVSPGDVAGIVPLSPEGNEVGAPMFFTVKYRTKRNDPYTQ